MESDEVEIIEGIAYKLGDAIDCDAIIPVRYCIRPTEDILRERCLTHIDKQFPETANTGLILIAGRDFGRGSANENSVNALLACQVRAVVAESFARIFRRNAPNLGLPTLACPGVAKKIQPGDRLKVDLNAWTLSGEDGNLRMKFAPVSPIERDIILSGGLIPYLVGRRDALGVRLKPNTGSEDFDRP